MAHEVENMAYAGKTPWHGLGTNIDANSSIEAWQLAAGLDWTVSKRPVQFNGTSLRSDDSTIIPQLNTFKDKFVLTRDTDDRPFSIVSSRYKPVQPSQILEFFRDLIADFDMKIETAGSLRDGQRVWALAKTGNMHKVLGIDQVDSYLLLATSYDLTFSTLAQFTTVRVVCNNTLQQSFADHSGRVTIPHFREFDEGAIKEDLGAGLKQWNLFAASMDRLALLQLDTIQATELLLKVYPVTNDPLKAEQDQLNKNHIAAIMRMYQGEGIGADMVGQTGWGLINAVTEYLDHERRARNQGNRLDSAWFGDSFIIKQRVYDELMLKLA